MLNYKGFKIPETSEDTVECCPMSHPYCAILHSCDGDETLSTTVSIEEVQDTFALCHPAAVEALTNKFKELIDKHVEEV